MRVWLHHAGFDIIQATSCDELITFVCLVQLALQPAREARAHLKATAGLSGLPEPPSAARTAAVAAAGGGPGKAQLQVIVRIEDLVLVVPVTSR